MLVCSVLVASLQRSRVPPERDLVGIAEVVLGCGPRRVFESRLLGAINGPEVRRQGRIAFDARYRHEAVPRVKRNPTLAPDPRPVETQ